ncbi:hypothetical protein MMC14_007635 [Varicellaria rhodocarpa]|nr:hypothetical protein [Varicellaria rhodocarpa]
MSHRPDPAELKVAMNDLANDPALQERANITMEMIEEEYERACSFWQTPTGWASTDWIQELARCFRIAMSESSDIPVTRAVCLGLGSFLNYLRFPLTADNMMMPFNDPVHRYGPFHQLLALELYVWLLNLHRGDDKIAPSQIFFQDPDFTDNDISFLSSKGYTVLDAPVDEDTEGCDKVTSTTFLYTPYVPTFVAILAFTVDLPIIYIGHSYKVFLDSVEEQGLDLSEAESSRLHDIGRNWSEAALPKVILAADMQPVELPGTVMWKPNKGTEISKTDCTPQKWQMLSEAIGRTLRDQRYEEYYEFVKEYKGQDSESAYQDLIAAQKRRERKDKANQAAHAKWMEAKRKEVEKQERKRLRKEEAERKEEADRLEGWVDETDWVLET